MIDSSWSIYSVLTPLFKRIRTAEFTSSKGPWAAIEEREPLSLFKRDFHSNRFFLNAACLEGRLSGHLPESFFRVSAQAQPL
jgi:hypothetical protein